MEDLTAVVADAVRRARAGQQISQATLGALAGLSRATLADLETGRRKVSLDDAVALCAALGVRLADLLAAAPQASRALGLVGERSSDADLQHVGARLSAADADAFRRTAEYTQAARDTALSGPVG